MIRRNPMPYDMCLKLRSKVPHMKTDELYYFMYSMGFWDDEFFLTTFLRHWKEKPRFSWSMEDEMYNKRTGMKPVYESPKFHQELRDAQNAGSSIIIVSRGFGKTTCSRVRIIKMICYAHLFERKSLLLWAKHKLMKKSVKSIRDEFEQNTVIKSVFGDLRPDMSNAEKAKAWNKTQLYFRNGYYLEGCSVNNAVRGDRFDDIVCDDVQSNEDVANPEMVAKFDKMFRTEVRPTLNPGGRLNIVGTIVSEDCLVNEMYNSDDFEDYAKIKYNAITDFKRDDKGRFTEGHLLWPERFSLDTLNTLFKEMGNTYFKQEFLNMPHILNNNPVFDPDWFKYVVSANQESGTGIRFFDPKPQTDCVLGIDVAMGKAGGDYQAMTCRSIKDYRLLWTYESRIQQEGLVELITRLYMMGWRFNYIVPETNSAGVFMSYAKSASWYGKIWRNQRKFVSKKSQMNNLGFYTSRSSKEDMKNIYRSLLLGGHNTISEYDDPAKENPSGIFMVDDPLKVQIENFYYNKTGGMEARPGHHDDLLMADMITCYVITEEFRQDRIKKGNGTLRSLGLAP